MRNKTMTTVNYIVINKVCSPVQPLFFDVHKLNHTLDTDSSYKYMTFYALAIHCNNFKTTLAKNVIFMIMT